MSSIRSRLFLAASLAALLAASCSSTPRRAVESQKRGASIDLIEEGGALEAEGLYQQAINRYKQAIESKPSPQAHYRLGRCYRNLGENEIAAIYLEKAIEASPGYALARYELAYVEDLIEAENKADRLKESKAQLKPVTTELPVAPAPRPESRPAAPGPMRPQWKSKSRNRQNRKQRKCRPKKLK